MALDKVFGFVLMAMCLSAMTIAFSLDNVETMAMDDSSDKELEMMELEKAMTSLEKLKQLFDARKQNGQCSCTGLTCQCCQTIKIREIHLNAQCCISLTFRPQTGTLIVALTIDGHNVYREEFPVSKPISPCIRFKVAKVCLQFRDFRVDSKTFTGCSSLTFSIFGRKIAQVELGCFHIHFLDTSKPLLSAETPVVEPATIIENADDILFMKKENVDEEDKAIDKDNKI